MKNLLRKLLCLSFFWLYFAVALTWATLEWMFHNRSYASSWYVITETAKDFWYGVRYDHRA